MSSNKNNSNKTIESFSAKILEGDNDKHSNLIKEAIDDKNIFNVALSGAYGSGKTSIIKTFKHKYPSLKYIDVSLATFDDKLTDKDSLLKLEYCILKQLFYKVSPEKVPQSRFKRIVNHKNTSLNAILFFIWLISIFYFLNNKLLNSLIQALGLNHYCAPLNAIFSIYSILGLGFIVYKIYDFVINFKMTKLKFSEAELENNNDKATLNFENEIDEILYFFERNPTHVVFIEDLDRFKNTEIFIKLREINFLINNYDPIKEKGKVTFIYAVLDDIFSQNERTKFFDLILPVVPIVNYTNSAKELLDRFDNEINLISNSTKKNNFKKFIEKVSLYLTDMRVIISISNEYKIYKLILDAEKIDEQKLLAMMIYKNKAPNDFDLLNKREGYIYTLFNSKKNYIKSKISEFENEIKKIKPKIEESKNEYIISEKELRLLYVAKFYELIKQNISGITINGNNTKVDDLISEENFNLFKIQQNISYYNAFTHIAKPSNTSFKDVEKAIHPKLSYDDRLKNVKNKISENLETLKREIEDYEKKIKDINSKSLSELLKNDINSEIFFQNCKVEFEKQQNDKKNKDVKNNISETITNDNNLMSEVNSLNFDLINLLIETGNIDEDYEHYISRQDGNLTKEDRDFLLSFNSTPLPFETPLNGFDTILNRLDDSYYYKRGILNFSLISYLLNNDKNDLLNKIFSQLSEDSEYYFKFIDEYWNQIDKNLEDKFINLITISWSDLFSYIQDNSTLTIDKKSKYINSFFEYLSIEKIKEINKKKSIFYFLSYSNSLSSIYFEDKNRKKVEQFIIDERLRFGNIEFEEQYVDLLKFIYDNNSYEINERMIELMISTFKKSDVEIEFEHLKNKNYTTILNSECDKLIEYINSNVEEYIENVFLEIEENTEEEEKSILDLIELIEDNLELQKKIINKQNIKITNLNDVISDLWDELFTKNKIIASWNNLLIYYKEFDSLYGLESFLEINENYKLLSDNLINDEKKEIVDKFIVKLINLKITKESFSYLVKSIDNKYDDITTLELENLNKLRILIDNDKVNPTNENINYIYNHKSEEYIFLIERNEVHFQKDFDLFILNEEIVYNLITNSHLSTESISLITNKYNDIICELSKDKLNQISDTFISKNFTDYTTELFFKLLESIDEIKIKIDLFTLMYDKLSEDEIYDVLDDFGEPFNFIRTKENFNIKNTHEISRIINLLSGRFFKKPNLIKRNTLYSVKFKS